MKYFNKSICIIVTALIHSFYGFDQVLQLDYSLS